MPSNFRRLCGNITYLWTIPYMMSFLRSRHFLTVETLVRRDKMVSTGFPRKEMLGVEGPLSFQTVPELKKPILTLQFSYKLFANLWPVGNIMFTLVK